jgi:D-beta-D-heptose 7-phosphate kinase/D-beta-D-heptose 1-phosphate adenosyltransferase
MSQLQKQLKVILIGDTCIDEYQYGTVDRISTEAPVPIFVPHRTEIKSGMANNVKDNLVALGIHVEAYTSGVSKKTRLIDTKSKQHLLRIDEDTMSIPCNLDYILTTIGTDVDAFVISDYEKGFVSTQLIKTLRKQYNGPIFVDTKKRDLKQFEGCIVKINEVEYKNRISGCTDLIVTRGSKRVEYKDKTYEVPCVPTFDVCGAGDTFLASLTYGYLTTNNMDSAIEFAIKASSITVQHIGVYAPSLGEINAA